MIVGISRLIDALRGILALLKTVFIILLLAIDVICYAASIPTKK